MGRKVSVAFGLIFLALNFWGCRGERASDQNSTPPSPTTNDAREQTVDVEPVPKGLAASNVAFIGNITQNGEFSWWDFGVDGDWQQMTPENESKWDAIAPTQGGADWSTLDNYYNRTRQLGIPMKGHTLCWGSQEPEWVGQLPTNTAKVNAVRSWIQTYCSRYPDMEYIDVVNEADHWPPTYAGALNAEFRSNHPGHQTDPHAWVLQCFEWAEQYCPNAQLIYNDFNTLTSDTEMVATIAQKVADMGWLDGIGAQAHFIEWGMNMSGMAWNENVLLQKLDQLGAISDIFISEWDVRDVLGDNNEDQDPYQPDYTAEYILKTQLPIFYTHPAVRGITFWGYKEDQMWQSTAELADADGNLNARGQWIREYRENPFECGDGICDPLEDEFMQRTAGDSVKVCEVDCLLPVAIPARIEAEDYVAANENTLGMNSGGACDRGDGVDMEVTGDAQGGNCNVGWTDAGEWLAYSFSSAADGVYDIFARVASASTGRTFRMEIDDEVVGSGLTAPGNGWQVYSNVGVSNVSIEAGTHTLTVFFGTGDVNLNWVDFISVGPTCDDGVQNQDETGVDCGGSCPVACDGEGCVNGSDCISGVCVDEICAFSSCDDGVMNGDETGVDCGGNCPLCIEANVPGRIEAEDYFDYSDSNSQNEGASDYPSCDNGDGVDLGEADDVGGTCSIGWTSNGEWVDYELLVGTSASFDIVARAGSGTSGGAFRVLIDGVVVNNRIDVNNIGWDAYENYSVASEYELDAGTHTMRVQFLGSMNLNWIEFTQLTCMPTTCTAAGAECDTIPDNCGGTLDCGSCGGGDSCIENMCVCTPTTCEIAVAECGYVDDACGGSLFCGNCGVGEQCNGSNVCECAPTSCDAAGADCGTMDDGCGTVLNCGSCGGGDACIGNICTCVPTTCDAAGAMCGTIDDACGGALDCGGCAPGQQCNGSNQCECAPVTCDMTGANCGAIDDGCGNTLECGVCSVGQACVANVCECIPTTCLDEGAVCGSISDGCGGMLDCGSCNAGEVCNDSWQCIVAPTCDDGIRNQDETDVDCGGGCPVACDDLQGCLVHSDCISGVCEVDTCAAPTCDDGVMNGDETGIDCGGSCLSCVIGNVPGRIEAEAYVAFNDSDNVNDGASDYPSCDNGDGVDLGVADEDDGTCSIGWTSNGEWLDFELVLGANASFDIVARAGSGTSGGAFRVLIDGVVVNNRIDVNNIGWKDYENYSVASEYGLEAGTHTMRVQFLGSMNLNWIEFAAVACIPTTCDMAGANCGTIEDGCGNSLECGTCGVGNVCTDNICTCVPTSCEAAGAMCGTIDDGCGGVLNCGGCASGEQCNGSNQCECAPMTCDMAGANCGAMDDGCGNSLDCGSCGTGEACVANVCECIPTTCLDEGAVCGSIGDGCGGTLDCGSCSVGEVCNDASQCMVVPTCDDGIQNQDETDVDCGGGCPEACDESEGCLVNSDCVSGVCESDVCAAPTCDDGVMNGDETDIDCGGSCPSCINANVPGRMEAEDYVDFNDSDNVNEGASDSPSCDRGDGVDMGLNTDTGGSCTVGWTAAGEWLEYELTVTDTAYFDIVGRAGSGTDGGAFRVLIDGVDMSGGISVSNNGWTSYANYTVATDVILSAGTHTMRVEFLGSMNLNWLEFSEVGVCTPTTCSAASAECGTISDGCGGSLVCGSCGAGETCNESNQCTSTPTGCTCPGGCDSVTNQTQPFAADGAHDNCYFFISLGRFLNSWGTSQVNINGIDATNTYLSSSQYPDTVDGGYYVYLESVESWAHLGIGE